VGILQGLATLPMLLLTAQNDLSVVLEGIPGLLNSVRNAGVTHEFVWVPGFAHFYPTGRYHSARMERGCLLASEL
jgi:hypothetical protein